MKKTILLIEDLNQFWQLLFAFLLLLFSKITIAAAAPTVTLIYASIFDPICSTKTSYKIDPVWIEELNSRITQWQKLWDQEGSVLLKTSEKLIGKPFPQNHFYVPLTLCTFPSMSTPLMVNVRYSLNSFIVHPIKSNTTISIIEHEVLHVYIDSFLPKKTPLLIKYKNESQTVLNHLHLFALQKATYLILGWNTRLHDIITKDDRLPNPDYKRAWEIVKQEGYAPFIAELKSDY